LISADLDKIKGTNADELNVEPYPGVNTIYKAVERRINKPNLKIMPFMGTRIDKEYHWLNVSECHDIAKKFAAGAAHFDLNPEIDAEDSKWRFIGI